MLIEGCEPTGWSELNKLNEPLSGTRKTGVEDLIETDEDGSAVSTAMPTNEMDNRRWPMLVSCYVSSRTFI